jgi:hypothetical protein
MRTKTLICAAALAAGIATSAVAQSNVYSLNVVGYYNVNVPANTTLLVGNQLNTTNNSLPGIIPNPPPGSQFQYFSGGGLSAYVFDDVDLQWEPDATGLDLSPGHGGYFKSPVATTVTFVGEVKQGSLTNTFTKNAYVVRTAQVPISTNLVGMQLLGEPGDQIQTYSGGFSAFVFDDVDLQWEPGDPAGPTIAVGGAFFYRKAGNNLNWVQNFTVQ